MEGESHSMRLCSSGCGFFGSPATDGMCSKCFKESVKKKQQSQEMSVTPAPTTSGFPISTGEMAIIKPIEANPSSSKEIEEGATASSAITTTTHSSTTTSGEDSSGSQESKSDKDALKKKNRCALCRKKVGLTGFDCRCGGLYCAAHRYSDKHDCTFDYRELGVQEIRRKNPVVTGQKIQKI